ncbi:hypothetical protein QQY24_06365 [Streptomyces sp. TG1A-8]|uniref:hypothetical protein n=1 Tax=Streptomyces sp. TG1A-8 TaxID=3051385 RepID=UPI00265C59B6|nr:hypothetical protein [Streptomyces sp. TG1A-8]MDO0925059.1 hypothetical protein [Streptomyces sp. TG1A-8]
MRTDEDVIVKTPVSSSVINRKAVSHLNHRSKSRFHRGQNSGWPMSIAQRFLLDIPDPWQRIDPCSAELAGLRARILASTEDAREKERIDNMFRQGREVIRGARRHEALLTAGTATLHTGGLFMAYGMVIPLTTPGGQGCAPPVPSVPLSVPPAAGAPPEDRVVTTANVPRVGEVTRVIGTEVTRLTGDTDVALLTMHTMMPVPGTTGDFLVVSLASPNLPLKKEVHDLFDAITSTFRFVTDAGAHITASGAALVAAAADTAGTAPPDQCGRSTAVAVR